MMHSMVAAFSPYTVKRRRVEIVRGYCYRFFQCSFPCGIVMLILSVVFLIVGSTQLIYIIHFNGCNTFSASDNDSDSVADEVSSPSSSLPSASLSPSSSSSWRCNRQTMKVLGITFAVTGAVLFLISLLITKYSRSSEENNVIRTTASSLLPNTTKHASNHHLPHHQHHPSTHYYRTPSGSLNDPNSVIVSLR